MSSAQKVLVFGATGNIGGATARELLERGWQVRAVTRKPEGEKARQLSNLGAEVVKADMDDRGSLDKAFDGIRKVLSVQNWNTSGIEGEARQGKLVAEAARAAGVDHLVFASGGTGEPDTGIPHFDSKLDVEAHMRRLQLPFTTIRPGPFMELMTDKQFFPAVGTWGVEPKLVGWDTPKPWTAVRDIGRASARIFANPDSWIGREICLIGDVRSLSQCRDLFLEITGKKPFRIPLPTGLMEKMAGSEMFVMWRWIGSWVKEAGADRIWQMVASSRDLVPDLLNVESWLRLKQASQKKAVERHQSRAY
jgi:uncharacterized protein YbjT (DUF2867 family)